MNQLLENGSARRLLVFLVTLLVICLSHYLQLGTEALTAVTTLGLGYLGQGAAKEIFSPKYVQVVESPSEEKQPAQKIGF